MQHQTQLTVLFVNSLSTLILIQYIYPLIARGLIYARISMPKVTKKLIMNMDYRIFNSLGGLATARPTFMPRKKS